MGEEEIKWAVIDFKAYPTIQSMAKGGFLVRLQKKEEESIEPTLYYIQAIKGGRMRFNSAGWLKFERDGNSVFSVNAERVNCYGYEVDDEKDKEESK